MFEKDVQNAMLKRITKLEDSLDEFKTRFNKLIDAIIEYNDATEDDIDTIRTVLRIHTLALDKMVDDITKLKEGEE